MFTCQTRIVTSNGYVYKENRNVDGLTMMIF